METKKMPFKSEKKTAGGASFQPHEVKDARGAFQAVMNITLNHTADVLVAVVKAISDHYKIPQEEMMEVVRSHPAYTGITLHPVLNDLGYCHPVAEDEEEPIEPVEPEAKPAEPMAKPEAKPKAKVSKKKFIVRRMSPPNESA